MDVIAVSSFPYHFLFSSFFVKEPLAKEDEVKKNMRRLMRRERSLTIVIKLLYCADSSVLQRLFPVYLWVTRFPY
jgi:hypothetical protein